jgi:hypothetical protein
MHSVITKCIKNVLRYLTDTAKVIQGHTFKVIQGREQL